LFSAITTAWPDIVAPGSGAHASLFTSFEALANNIIETEKDSQAGETTYAVALPWAVLDIGDFEQDQDWGVTSQNRRAKVTVWYIGLHPTVTQKDVNGKAFALGEYIDKTVDAFTYFQPIERSRIDSGPNNAFNEYARAQLNAPLIGACVEWSPGVLVA
jgi:hypothetical protein